ncbi:TonB family protein [Roseateles saccharophilus]|uniref:TonB family protein n=1 Tax=Roseateles saccharophilus TaxID=304 RepID=A0A4R3VC20_ROSSA|nr:TonB family protein [Roseateles saccharophilus]MDG0831814.1 TonB family protein [Roseateles saccharophilus]TCV01164.1 TonB family protein [Roseateles saccharophilus]
MRLSAAGPATLPVFGPRLNRALAFSLLVHGLLLSLSFGQGLGLPGLDFPWQTRRGAAAELRVVLEAPPLPQAPPAPPAPAAADAATAPDTRTLRLAEPDGDVAPLPESGFAVLAVERPAAWAVAAASAVPTAAVAAFAGASSPAVQALSREVLRPRERPVDLAPLDAARQELQATPAAAVAAFQGASAPAVETLRRAAAELSPRASERSGALAELEAMRASDKPSAVAAFASASSPAVEALRRAGDALRVRSEPAERSAELAQLEGSRQEALQRAERLEAARLEGQRQESARQDAARAEAARAEAVKLAATQAEAAQREARLRAIGRQLDEEAARRDALARGPSSALPTSYSSLRRGRLFGQVDSNTELVLYAEAWARKIQLNQTFEKVREAAQAAHADPLVTVAIRSDGSVESVSFVRSSGVPALDEAIRQVVLGLQNYPAFPPALARDYDVVEIRRSWRFDSAIRLY